MTEPVQALVRESVEFWNYDPVLFGFQQVDYISCGEENQISEYEKIHKSRNSVGYTSDLYVGQEARDFLSGIWPDFKHHSIDVAIHERLSGYAGIIQAVGGLAEMCKRSGVNIVSGVEVTGYDVQGGEVKDISTTDN